MALNEMEFLGNDRYFKYRYAQDTIINITTITESWEIESHASWYKIFQDYWKRSLNMRIFYELHKVGYRNVSKLYTAPDAFNNVNAIFISLPRSFFDGRHKYFSPAPVFETARTIIVSAAPKRVVSTSISFLNMNANVVILTMSTLVLLSLLLVIHSIVTNKYKSLPSKNIVKKMAHETLGIVWENASLLCSEPIPSILPNITYRLLTSSWLIGVTFILIFLSCFLRTEFTTESYDCIDTLSDLIKSRIPPVMMDDTGTLEYLKYLATQDPVVKEWLEALDEERLFSSRKDYRTLDGYIPIASGDKALVTVDTYLTWTMGQFLGSDSDSKMYLKENGGLYFSQQVLGFDYLHLIFNTSWVRSNLQLHENIQLSLQPIFETQVFKYLFFDKYHSLEQVKWKRPLKSTANLDLSSVFVPFYMLFMPLSGTVAVLITEIFFNHFAKTLTMS